MSEGQPVLRVIRGGATPEELAAVVALLTAASGAVAEPEPQPRALWASPQLRRALDHGPAAWRASSLPQ